MNRRHLALVAPAVAALGLLIVLPAVSSPQGAAAPKPSEPPSNAYRVDPVHSKALFRVQHMGAGAFWGRFNTVQGTIAHDDAAQPPLRIEVTIPVQSVDTGSERLDGHLKSPDFFSAEQFPELSFKTTGARKTGDHMYEVSGDLTMRGVTKQVSVPVEWVGTADGPAGKRCGFEAVFTVNRNDYQISYGPGALGDDVRLIVAMEGVIGGPPPSGGGGNERRGAGGPGRDPAARFAELDANKDGKLQKDELPERMQARFDQLDTNKDGAIDAAEFAAARPPGRG